MLQHDAQVVLKKLSDELNRTKRMREDAYKAGYREGLAKAGLIILGEVQRELPAWAKPFHEEFIEVID